MNVEIHVKPFLLMYVEEQAKLSSLPVDTHANSLSPRHVEKHAKMLLLMMPVEMN